MPSVKRIPFPVTIKRLLGNNILIRFLDQPKPEFNGIAVPLHVIPQNPRAVVLMLGEGRLNTSKTDKNKHRGHTRHFRQRHERELLSTIQPGDLVQVNTEMGRVPVEYKGQACHIVSTLDIQAQFEIT